MPLARRFAAAIVCASALLAAPAAEAQKKRAATDTGTFDSSGSYILTESELKLDCKKITGRTNIRVLQLRAELAESARPSGAAQTLQQVTGPAVKLMYGGASGYGTDRDAQMRRDRAVIEAFNRRLAEKNCATYDIDAELKKGPNDPPPAPVKKK